MKYGCFDDENREYIITNPKTPTQWINYVGTLAFGGFVDHTGGALLCKRDPALNRITKYIPQLPASSFKGTTLYLRFRVQDGYRIFSPYFVPTLSACDLYECHIGLGYTRIVSEFYGIRTDATFFVPVNGSQMLQDIRITHASAGPLEIDAVPVVEYTHFDALKQFTNADWVPQTMQSRVHDAGGRRILTQFAFMRKDTAINYLTSNLPVSSFESERRRFLGDNEYATWANPLALQQDELSDSQAHRGDNIGALLHHLGRLEPGETARLIVQLGQAQSVAEALPSVLRYSDARHVEEALAELKAFWGGLLSKMAVQTPSADMDRMLNIHNPRQCYITKQWSRDLSLYQLGFGGRGIGFRDSAQDVMGVAPLAPDEARDMIRLLLRVQKRNGSAMHQFYASTLEANEGDSREAEGGPRYYCDDHLWIVLAASAYLRETGDLAFLDEIVPFYEKDREGRPLEEGTVFEHMHRALEFTRGNVGAHGLPLLGFADWNDTVNLPAGAESMFAANLYGKALLEMTDLARYLSDADLEARCSAAYSEMEARFNAQAWDGEWFIRYFDADGRPLGSRANAQGQIFANAQSWPVISGFAASDRGRAALDAAHTRLNTRNGIKLSAPGFQRYDPKKGGITTYPPGAKENGGIFLHANPWMIIAEALLGNGDRAFQYYEQINPAARNDRIDEYQCEPYVYAQNILGDEHPQFGLARNSWLTGTASWAYQAATQYILGIQPTYDGLRIDPCIPAVWDGFTVRRMFRGAVYVVEVRNPGHVCKGVRGVKVNGSVISGNVIPVQEAGGTHSVQVELGR